MYWEETKLNSRKKIGICGKYGYENIQALIEWKPNVDAL